MTYYEKKTNDNGKLIIVRYEIYFDENKLKELRKEIIDNCSKINKIEAIISEKDINSYYSKDEHIVNFKKGEYKFEKNDFESLASEKFYRCSYDELIFPEIIDLIDKILSNDIYVRDEIANSENHNVEIKILKNNILKLNNDINNIDNLDVDNKINKLLELKEAIDKYKYEEKMCEYYNRLHSLISVDKIGEMTQDDLDNVIGFFNDINTLEKIKKL